MPAWSVPGCHSTSLPRMRSKRHRMSCKVLLSAWPICSEPVTFGGGNDDGVGLGSGPLRPAGAKGARSLPFRGDTAFHGGGIEGLFHHERRTRFLRKSLRQIGELQGWRNKTERRLQVNQQVFDFGKSAVQPRPRATRSISARTRRSTETRQIVVEPGLQHRPQQLPRRPLDEALVALQQGFGQSLEGGADFRVARRR